MVPQKKLKATAAAVEVNLRFPGQYFDEESNLNYNYFRSYNAAQGRYSHVVDGRFKGGYITRHYGRQPWSVDEPQ